MLQLSQTDCLNISGGTIQDAADGFCSVIGTLGWFLRANPYVAAIALACDIYGAGRIWDLW